MAPKRKPPAETSAAQPVPKRKAAPAEPQEAAAPEPRAGPELPAASAVASDGKLVKKAKVIVILERACLETGKVGKDHVLLNADDHNRFIHKHKRNPADFRPDILHQSMLILLDSPLNKAGLLRLYVRSERGVLIEVNPGIRIPRTFKRFCGLMTQLLHKLSIRASNGSQKLLKVIKNPMTDHLPPDTRIVLLSVTGRLVDLNKYVPTMPTHVPICFVVGSMAHGKVECDYAQDEIAISEYPLSGAAALGRLAGAWETHLGII